MARGKIRISDIIVVPIWSESRGAKSFSIYVDTGDVKILIDPGVSVMQPSFPISDVKKAYYAERAWSEITKYVKKADLIITTHYHYDHFSPSNLEIYGDKIILAKNPNEYINNSQRERAVDFYMSLYTYLTGSQLELEKRKKEKKYENPLDFLPKAMSIDYGDYKDRKKNLLEKGLKWYQRLIEKWNKWPEIPEIKFQGTKIYYADGKKFDFGGTTIRFLEPMFHGIEFSRVGWVIPVIIEKKGVKILYTSDLNGPIIEDYADVIIRENPDILFIDGPATYMIPYTVNLINFRRALNNLKRIITNVKSKMIFLDHHLTRDIRFRKRLKEVYDLAKQNKKEVLTFSEAHGSYPLAEKIFNEKKKSKPKNK